jgi:hypothetical protein
VLGDGLAPGRLAANVAANFLLALGFCSGERGFELRPLPIVEHHGEHVERELRFVLRQVL